MKAPVHRLKKTELVWLSNHHCQAHRKDYLTHYTCFLKETPNQTRFAVLDLETSNLKADYGIILTWALKPLGQPALTGMITPADIRKGRKGDEDRRLVRDCIDACLKFDHLITFYGSRFDLPFLRARALHMKEPFPYFDAIKHTDVYDIVRHRFCMSRKSQEVSCRFLLGHTDKTHFDGSIWRDAARGDHAALDQVLDHNIKDVNDLEKLYKAVINYSRRNDLSI